MQLKENILELRDICGIVLEVGDTVTVNYNHEGVQKRMRGEIESHYIMEEEKMMLLRDPIGDLHYFYTDRIGMWIEKFRRDYRFN